MTGCGPCSDLPAAHCGGEGAGLIPAPGASQPAPASRLFHPRDTLPTCGLGVQGDCRGPRYVGAGLWPGVRKQGEGVAVRPPGLGYDMEEVPARGSELVAGGGQWGANLGLASTPSLFQNHGTRWACSCGLPVAGRARGPWSEGQSLSQPGTLLWALSTHRHTPAARTCLCTLRPHLAGASLLPAPTQFPARTAQRPGRPGFGPHRAAGGLACRSPHPPGPRTAH